MSVLSFCHVLYTLSGNGAHELMGSTAIKAWIHSLMEQLTGIAVRIGRPPSDVFVVLFMLSATLSLVFHTKRCSVLGCLSTLSYRNYGGTVMVSPIFL